MEGNAMKSETLKSHTERFFLGLYDSLLRGDMVRQYGDRISFTKDCDTLRSRVKNEGFTFLTKGLPSLGKAIDRALLDGYLTPPAGFKLSKSGIPVFLSGLLKYIFGERGEHGKALLRPPSSLQINAVRDVRQICFLLYKYEMEYDPSTISDFLEKFKLVDLGLGFEKPELSPLEERVISCARRLLHDLLCDFDYHDIVEPRHGPGAVASGENPWEKMDFKVKYDCIHQVFPYYKFFVANAMDLASQAAWYRSLEKAPSGVAKVALVPKDSRGPRLISMEPLEFQWVQQGLGRALMAYIERHRLTKGHVNFEDQEVNRNLALRGSHTRDCVTLDMSEASDRVSCWLVSELFRDTPILNALFGTRTEATELPTGEIHLLRKFAPMGSALCFPIESLVHWSLSVATLQIRYSLLRAKALSAVFVYGDDIIIQGQNHEALFDTFPSFKLKFNEDKSCLTGNFRESCGMDAYCGENITVCKVKKPLPHKPADASGYASYIDYSNFFWNNAYYSTSSHIGSYLRRIYGEIPHVVEKADSLGYVTRILPPSNRSRFQRRWNRRYHRWEWRVRALRTSKISRANDRGEYLRKLLTRSEEFRAGIYTIPRRVYLKRGWTGDLI